MIPVCCCCRSSGVSKPGNYGLATHKSTAQAAADAVAAFDATEAEELEVAVKVAVQHCPLLLAVLQHMGGGLH